MTRTRTLPSMAPLWSVLSALAACIALLLTPRAASAQGCNSYGCWHSPYGSCNSYGCTEYGQCNPYGCPPGPGGGCNSYGCWQNGGGCNPYGCWNSPYGVCNPYGCSDHGQCTPHGCPQPQPQQYAPTYPPHGYAPAPAPVYVQPHPVYVPPQPVYIPPPQPYRRRYQQAPVYVAPPAPPPPQYYGPRGGRPYRAPRAAPPVHTW